MKKILINAKARTKITGGIDKLADLVGITLGPCGRNVVLERENGSPLVTNDGVTIAREFKTECHFENLAANVVLQASTQTNKHAGDGTTSAIVLAREITKLGSDAICGGMNPVALKEELTCAVEESVAELKKLSKPATNKDLVRVAISSCGNETNGKLIADAFEKVGTDGVVTLEENQSGTTSIAHAEGMEIDAELSSPYMIENPTLLSTIYENANIKLFDDPITKIADITSILEEVHASKIPCVILAPSFSNDVINAILINRVKGGLPVISVKITELDERRQAILDDIRALTNGRCKKIVASMNSCKIFTDGQENENLAKRIAIIKAQIDNAPNDYTKTKLSERVAKLTKGIAVISVGAPTEIELKEKKLRIEDAIAAVRAASTEGITTGGGVTYLNISKVLSQQTLGGRLLADALKSITRQICINAGVNHDEIMSQLLQNPDFNFGYDARMKEVCDLYARGIIDPSKVIREVIQNATSVAATLLTTEAIICNDR